MTLDTLFTICGILVAVLTIMRPVQRHSILLFVPLRWIALALIACFVLIVCRDAPFGVEPPFGWPLQKVVFFMTLAAFSIPVGAAVWAWQQSTVKVLASVYILVWLISGLALVVFGWARNSEGAPVIAAAKQWLGFAIAAAYAYFGINP